MRVAINPNRQIATTIQNLLRKAICENDKLPVMARKFIETMVVGIDETAARKLVFMVFEFSENLAKILGADLQVQYELGSRENQGQENGASNDSREDGQRENVSSAIAG